MSYDNDPSNCIIATADPVTPASNPAVVASGEQTALTAISGINSCTKYRLIVRK